jgi:hypothetical protein
MVEERKFKTGAKPTPRYKLLTARPHKAAGVTPPQVIVVPSFLEMWLNDQYGDCVTAEEAFAKAAYAVQNGQPETKITDATVKAFCDKYDLLNGAELPQVMDLMVSDGFHQDQGYKDGPYVGVDYSNEAVLQNAISIGPVKIGISSSSLPSGAGNANGWYAFGGQSGAQDHCTALCGYGPTSALFQALGTPVPSGAPPSAYLQYTWGTIGVVDHAWIMAACGEAWLRNPTTPGIAPVCPPGQHLDPATGKCVPDVPPVCPPGQHWDATQGMCVPDIVPQNFVVNIPAMMMTGTIFGLPIVKVSMAGITVPVVPGSTTFGAQVIPWTLLWVIIQQGLHFVCANPGIFGPNLQPIISQICQYLPHAKGPCGGNHG